MLRKRLLYLLTLAILASLLLAPVAQAVAQPESDGASAPEPTESPRLIVELQSEPLAVAYQSMVGAASVDGGLDVRSMSARQYIDQLRSEQAAFVSTLQQALPQASVASYINESGAAIQATYQVVLNGVAVDVGGMNRAEAKEILAHLPGVKNVYLDLPHQTDLYTSTTLINAPAIWNNPAIGGRANGGAGVKVASMDVGVHKDAPMFNGTGYAYPPGYGPKGLGATSNNNGKIIASRVYFRPWDPPIAGSENPWPGPEDDSHGVHTASTAAGNVITNVNYSGLIIPAMSGVAPKAYVMSYRVFYVSQHDIDSFYDVEGVAALEDIVKDDADVVNNSWGGGPSSVGGKFDALDNALINASKAGVFVSMSAGNSGPGVGTGDHPSDAYINVAWSTSGGTFADGTAKIQGVDAVPPAPFALASFGGKLEAGQVFTYSVLPSVAVNPANLLGCAAWPADTFKGKAALIQRGSCEFGVKALNAEKAGAVLAIVYNSAAGGDDLMAMGAGAVGNQVTIPAIFVGLTSGTAGAAYFTQNPNGILEVNTTPFQMGNVPDRIVASSSRGPGVGNTLKPDIAAPGQNILAQGYARAEGEAVHFGYGQASGTSMASPHVAGAAALLRQIHPNWSNAAIKSALMSTAKYTDVFNYNGTPAQPLDMGSGRLDLTKAADPGVILDPPSLSFGLVYTGFSKTITVTVRSVANVAETYNLSTLYTADSFTETTPVDGVSMNPTSLTLNPGETKSFRVTFDPATSQGIGDNQGYVVMDGSKYDAHLALWARQLDTQLADVLLIDADASSFGADDYRQYYMEALDKAGYSYDVLNYDLADLPPTTFLMGYRAIVLFTGDNSFNPYFSATDLNILTDYFNSGGTVIAFGQDFSNSTDTSFFYQERLGARFVQDSMTNEQTPNQLVLPTLDAADVFSDVVVDLTTPHIYSAGGVLLPENEIPAVITPTITGTVSVRYDSIINEMRVLANVRLLTTTIPVTVTGAHVHSGTVDANGPVIQGFLAASTFVTSTLRMSRVFTLTEAQEAIFLAGNTYANVHTNINPGGDIRVQLKPVARRNQPWMDEIEAYYPILRYPSSLAKEEGIVAAVNYDYESLEIPGAVYDGRSVYAAFGLEGMSEGVNATYNMTATTRSELLNRFIQWGIARPATGAIINATAITTSNSFTFTAQPVYGVQASSPSFSYTQPSLVFYRWDFGDGSEYEGTDIPVAGHTYACGATTTYTVRVQLIDNFGNSSVHSKEVNIGTNCENTEGPSQLLFMPYIRR